MADNVAAMQRIFQQFSPRFQRLFHIFHRIGSRLSTEEVNMLLRLAGKSIDERLKPSVKNGSDFLLAMLKSGHCDESNLRSILHVLQAVRRTDLTHLATLKRKREVIWSKLHADKAAATKLSRIPE